MRSSTWQYDAATHSAVIAEGVQALPPGTFRGARRLQQVYCPDSLTELPNDFCRHANALCSVRLSDGLSAIGAYAFADCSALRGLQLPASITKLPIGCCARDKTLRYVHLPDALYDIGDEAFLECSALEEVTLPAGLTHLGARAFAGATALRCLKLPTGLTELPQDALPRGGDLEAVEVAEGHPSLQSVAGALYTRDGRTLLLWPSSHPTRHLHLPEGVTHIATEAFRGARRLESIVFPRSLEAIGEAAFADCSVLQQVHFQSLPQLPSAEAATQGVFANCPALLTVALPQGLRHLPAFAFAGSGLKQIQWPDALTSVGRGACYGCALRTVLPDGVTEIGQGAFYGAQEVQLPKGLQATIGAAISPLQPQSPACDTVLAFTEGALFCPGCGTSAHWRDTLATLTCSNGVPNPAVLDGHFEQITAPEQRLLFALNRLEHPIHLSAFSAECYRGALQKDVLCIARHLIGKRDDRLLTALLRHVNLPIGSKPDLLQLAGTVQANGCMHLIIGHGLSRPRSFCL